MFANFLYILLALVIYTTSSLFGQAGGADTGGGTGGWVPALTLAVGFVAVCRLYFHGVFRRVFRGGPAQLDHLISRGTVHMTVLALVVFAVQLYGYRLTARVADLPLFRTVPTLHALVFVTLFLGYLVVVWDAAHRAQDRYSPGMMSRREYIRSNLFFTLPAILPWVCLSLVGDMIQWIPVPPIQAFFHTTVGETAYILVFLCAAAVFGPVLIKRLWRCRPLARGPVRSRIEAVCDTAGLRYADILEWDMFGGTMITAGVMGLVGRYRYILVTPALLTALDEDELAAVMLHEIGHVHHRHMVFYLLFFAGFVACNMVFFEPMLLLLFIAAPLYDGLALVGMDKTQAHPVIISAALIGFFLVYFRFGFGVFMRNFERQADLYLYRFHADATPLIRTFYKIAALSRQAIDKPNWHHFSIQERIRFLEACQQDPGVITRHHHRVRQLVTGFLVVVTGVFLMGYGINYGPFREGFETFVARHVLMQELAVSPEHSDLYVFVGDHYYDRGEFARAKAAYENVIRIDGDNVHALNNLAWLLVTCPDPRFRDYPEGLFLAARALDMAREPYILDTYAEALAANHRPVEALAAAREALDRTDDRQGYYRSQVARFQSLIQTL